VKDNLDEADSLKILILHKTELAYKEKRVKMKTGHMTFKDGVK